MQKIEKPDLNVELLRQENRRLAFDLRRANSEVRRVNQADGYWSTQLRDCQAHISRLRFKLSRRSDAVTIAYKGFLRTFHMHPGGDTQEY